MKIFGFEEANHIGWSNEYLDFVIASKLLILVYEATPEATIFRDSKRDLLIHTFSSG